MTELKQLFRWLRHLPVLLWRWYKARWKRVTFAALLLTTGLLYLTNRWITHHAEGKLFSDAEKTPAREVGLLLGSSKSIANGRDNLFFTYRIEAAVALYKAGKIKRIIVSGDNHIKGYDETTDMRNALLAAGVPDSCIIPDYAGFRTLDSVVRCKNVFGENSVTIISQRFHDERALFIADYYHMDAIAFCAKDVPARYSIRTKLREYLARFAAVLDLYVFHTSPHFS